MNESIRAQAPAQRLRIICLGYIVRGPLGGIAWHHMQYLLGLQSLGHDVWFLEDSDDYESCYDPERGEISADPSYGLAFAGKALQRIGFGARWAYHDAHTSRWHGPVGDRMPALCRDADLLINVSCINPIRPWLESIPRRVLIDTDPVFTQLDLIEDKPKRLLAEAHNVFFTFGESFGLPGCHIPDDGRPWQPTRQPVALSAWPVSPGHPNGRYTTVMLWDSYDRRVHDGMLFGMKAESMEPYVDLPQRCAGPFELALGGPTSPGARLEAAGWGIRNPFEVTRDPWIYQDYLRGSKAEFSVAKHGYVVSGSGWFSERSAGYLACGRPVVVQDTGFSRHIPVGEGLFAYRTPEEALAAIAEVEADYERHCLAARALVEEHFDARKVLTRLLDTATGTLPRAATGDPG